MRKATKKASENKPLPKICANATSLTSPLMRDRPVIEPTIAVERKSLKDKGLDHLLKDEKGEFGDMSVDREF